MPDLQIGINLDNTAAQTAARAVATALAAVVTTARQAGDAQDAAGNKGVAGFNKVRDASGRFVAGQAQVARATGDVTRGFEGMGGVADWLGKQMSGVAAQFTFLGLAQQGIAMLAQSFQQMQQSVVHATEALAEQREKLAELAALKGLLGMSTEAMRQDLGFRAQTLQTAAEARSFQESALGSGQSSIDVVDKVTGKVTKQGFISQEEMDRAMLLGGKFQAVEGGDAAAHGQLVGMLPMLMGRRVTGEEVAAKEQQLYNISQPGGASYSSMMAQLMKQAPLTTSHIFKDVADQLALTSMFTLTNKEGGGDMVQQFTRGTVGALGKMRGVKGFEGADSEKQAEYLKRIGATGAMDPIQIGKMISADLAQQEKVQGKDFNRLLYLQSRGYGNQEDVMALMSFSSNLESGTWKGFEDLARKAPDAGGIGKTLDAAAAADPRMRKRRVDVMEAMADAEIGGGAPEAYQDLMRGTFAVMKGDKEIGGEWKDIAAPSMLNPMANVQHMRVVERARQMLMAEAKRSGVSDKEITEAMKGGKTDEEQFSNVMNAIGRHRGKEVPGLEDQARIVDGLLRVMGKDEDAVRAAHMEPKPALPVGPATADPARPS